MLGITPQALYSQLLIGLINGSFYAVLSLGLAVIFGMLNIINFAHGAQYMMGAFIAWLGLTQVGPWIGNPEFQLNYWAVLVIAPLLVGAFGVIIERTMLARLYQLDHLYGLLLTFGIALIIEGLFRYAYGVSGGTYFRAFSGWGSCRFQKSVGVWWSVLSGSRFAPWDVVGGRPGEIGSVPAPTDAAGSGDHVVEDDQATFPSSDAPIRLPDFASVALTRRLSTMAMGAAELSSGSMSAF